MAFIFSLVIILSINYFISNSLETCYGYGWKDGNGISEGEDRGRGSQQKSMGKAATKEDCAHLVAKKVKNASGATFWSGHKSCYAEIGWKGINVTPGGLTTTCQFKGITTFCCLITLRY